ASAFRRIGQEFTDEHLKKALHRLSQKSIEDVLAAVGRGELPINDVVRAALPDADIAKIASGRRKPGRPHSSSHSDDGWFNIAKGIGLKFRWPGSSGKDKQSVQQQGLPIRGVRNDVPVSFEEGGAVPGDRIVGVLTDGEGIRI